MLPGSLSLSPLSLSLSSRLSHSVSHSLLSRRGLKWGRPGLGRLGYRLGVSLSSCRYRLSSFSVFGGGWPLSHYPHSVYIYIYTYICVYVYRYIYIYILYIHLSLSLYIYIYIYTHACVHIYIYIYIYMSPSHPVAACPGLDPVESLLGSGRVLNVSLLGGLSVPNIFLSQGVSIRPDHLMT